MVSRAVLFHAFRCWPGFQKLWLKGDFHSLLVSLLYGWTFVIVWLATFVWPEWFLSFLTPDWFAKLVLVVLWIAIAGSSLMSAIGAIYNNLVDVDHASRQSNLESAQELYLQANYFEAEQRVRKNMAGNAEDFESALLWIAILRRTRRIPQALELISNLDKLDAALHWLAELRSEKEQCIRIKIQTPPAHE